MATTTTAPRPAPSTAARSEPGFLAEVADFFREFIVAAFNPYRPEMHYMRGPDPANRAKTLSKN